jgi:hypothetical protein
MRSLVDRVERAAASVLRRGIATGRAVTPTPPEPVARVLRPVVRFAARGADRLDAGELRETEATARAALEADPRDGAAWLRLAQVQVRTARYDDAIESALRGAESGEPLGRALAALRGRPMRGRLGTAAHQARIRAIIDASPDSPEAQMVAGAFLLDQDELEPGRSMVRRAYRMRLAEGAPELAATLTDDAPSRAPDFMVLGPHKSGTTSLYAFLVQHPRIVPAPRKELRFWDRERSMDGASWERYEAYFPPLPAECGYLSGDGSPENLTRSGLPELVARRAPGTKTIVLHRDPVARAYSDYQMSWRLGASSVGPRPFDQMVERELRVLGPRPPLEPSELATPGVAPHLRGGCILPYVKAWVAALGPEQVMVVDSASLRQEREATLDALFAYLGLPPAEVPNLVDRNVAEYEPLDPELAARLREWYAPHEAALEAYLDQHAKRIPAG